MWSTWNSIVDGIEEKWKHESPEVNFGHIKDGLWVDNEDFEQELRQTPLYLDEWLLETKMKQEGLYTIPEEDDEDKEFPVHDSDTDQDEDSEVDEGVKSIIKTHMSDIEFDQTVSQEAKESTFEYAVWSWRVFYRTRADYCCWYIFKGEECMLVKPFGPHYGNSHAKYFYPLWKFHFGPGIETSVRNCRAYSDATQGKPQWIKLSRSVFNDIAIMGANPIEPDWNAIKDMNLKRKTRVLDENVYVVKWNERS